MRKSTLLAVETFILVALLALALLFTLSTG